MAFECSKQNSDPFEQVVDHIVHVFDCLSHILNNRKTRLLNIVESTRKEYLRKETCRQNSLSDMEELERALSGVSVKGNDVTDLQDETIRDFRVKMKRLATPEEVPFFHFLTPKLEELERELWDFGELIKSDVPEYSLRSSPVFTAGKRGSSPGLFDAARGIAIDEVNQQLFITDRNNGRVQVFSDKGEYLNKFGKCLLSNPFGVCVSDAVYVTDLAHHALFKFDKETLRLVDKVGKKGSGEEDFSSPHGLAADSFNQLYVTDSDNDRVCIYSGELSYLKQFGANRLRYPRDVKLTPAEIFVLDWGAFCVHIFRDNGDSYVKSIIKKEYDFDMQIKNPYFFCLDRADNVIISDGHHVLRVYNREGNIVHRIGGKGEKVGKFKKPNGLAVSLSGLLYVVSDNPNHTLQCF